MTLNVKALTEIADRLDGRDLPKNVGFTMNYFDSSAEVLRQREFDKTVYLPVDANREEVHECGTIACLAGLTKIMYPDANIDGFADAAKFLGLDADHQDDDGDFTLFHPDIETNDWDRVTPELAAKVIRNLITTGEVDWTIAGFEHREWRHD